MPVQIVYFARVREALGVDGESIEAQPAMTVSAVVDALAQRSAQHALAFADRSKLRFALDQSMVRSDSLIGEAKELAVFPPVTGG